jgi:hypothetical protein
MLIELEDEKTGAIALNSPQIVKRESSGSQQTESGFSRVSGDRKVSLKENRKQQF